jgi:type II secretory pathway component PulF
MKEFRYSALTSTGATVSGIRPAESKDKLALELMESGLVLLKSRQQNNALDSLLPNRRTSQRDLRDFTQHMATSLAAGIPAVTALGDFQASKQSKIFSQVIADIRSDVSSGTQLDEAFARHPQTFSALYLSLVKAGQATGNLDEAFEELVNYLDWNDNLRSQASQAVIYPILLLCAVVGLFLLMMLFVIPRFKGAFSSFGSDLPTLTVKMLAMGDFVGHWWWLILGGIAAMFVGYRMVAKTERGAYTIDRIMLSTPVLGSFMSKLALARFSKSFSLIFAAGTDLLQLLELLQGVVDNRVMAKQLAMVRQRVATGETLTASFADAPSFPLIIQRLIAVGEKTGSLDQSLIRASQHLDREIPRDLKKAFTIFEALIIAVLGVLICLAALSLLMPIMSIRADMG